MNKSTIQKYNFSLFCKRLIGIDKANLEGVMENFERVKRVSIYYLFHFGFTVYLVIAYGYFKADYYPLMGITFVSLLVTFIFYILKYNKKLSSVLTAVLFVYIPITNILIKDVFFLLQGNPLIATIFIHTHFMLILFISFSGLITHQRNTLYVGCISVVWVLVFSICINDTYLWSLVMLDTVFFIGISLLMYFVYSSSHSLVIGYDIQEQTINSQNAELKDLLEFKGKMLHLFVHDIKNPMNRIMTAGNKESIHRADIIEPSSHILQILGNILDVHKLEESKMVLKLSVFDLDDVCQKAITQVNYLCDEKKITLNSYASVNHCVEADAALLERVFINLLSNAIKFSELNSTIDLRITQRNANIRVEVIDTGEGIMDEDVDHIFDKHYQGKNQRTEFSHSSGLGLAFCKLVVEACGGQIGVESGYHLGTNLWFELPVKTNHSMSHDKVTLNGPAKYKRMQFEDPEILTCKEQLADVAVYQTGKILSLLNKQSGNSSVDFQYWKEELITASVKGNVEYYDELRRTD